MQGRAVYQRRYTAMDYVLAMVFFVIAAFVFIFATGVAFESTGFTRLQFLVILAVALIGSYVDIPVWTLRDVRPRVFVREVRAF